MKKSHSEISRFLGSYMSTHQNSIYRRYSASQTPTQKFKIRFSMLSSQEIGSSLVTLKMIFGAQQSELFRFKFDWLNTKIRKFPKGGENGDFWNFVSEQLDQSRLIS